MMMNEWMNAEDPADDDYDDDLNKVKFKLQNKFKKNQT